MPDAFEDDDSFSQIKDLGNGVRNFIDDNIDFIRIDKAFPSWASTCQFELDGNYGNNINICINTYNEFDHTLTNSRCFNPVPTWFEGMPYHGACSSAGDTNCGLDWEVLNNVVGPDTDYKFRMVCEGAGDPNPDS